MRLLAGRQGAWQDADVASARVLLCVQDRQVLKSGQPETRLTFLGRTNIKELGTIYRKRNGAMRYSEEIVAVLSFWGKLRIFVVVKLFRTYQ